jgi:hypothetical protein
LPELDIGEREPRENAEIIVQGEMANPDEECKEEEQRVSIDDIEYNVSVEC